MSARRERSALTDLPPKKIRMGLRRLQKAGITPERWLMMLDALPAGMQRIERGWPARPDTTQYEAGVVYDAAAMCRVLGLQCECSDPVPAAIAGYTTFYYGGWNLRELRTSKAGMVRMRFDDHGVDSHAKVVQPGYYQLCIRSPGTNRKDWTESVQYLQTTYATLQAAPVVVAATGLLAHLAETGSDLLWGDWCRCIDQLPHKNRFVLSVLEGRMDVSGLLESTDNHNLWLASICRNS